MTEETKFGDIEIKLYDSNKVLKFKGVKLAIENDKWIAGKEQNRWNEITLYKTKSGKYIVIEEYETRYQGEQNTIDYRTFENESELREHAKEIDDHLLNSCMEQAGMPIIITID